MIKKRENYFFIETFDEDLGMRIQFQYWTAGKYYYTAVEREDGVTVANKRISEARYLAAMEERLNA